MMDLIQLIILAVGIAIVSLLLQLLWLVVRRPVRFLLRIIQFLAKIIERLIAGILYGFGGFGIVFVIFVILSQFDFYDPSRLIFEILGWILLVVFIPSGFVLGLFRGLPTFPESTSSTSSSSPSDNDSYPTDYRERESWSSSPASYSNSSGSSDYWQNGELRGSWNWGQWDGK